MTGSARGTEKIQVIVRDPRTKLISAVNTIERPWPSEEEIANEIWPALRAILLEPAIFTASDPLIILPLPDRYLDYYRRADPNPLTDLLMEKIHAEINSTFAESKWGTRLRFDVDRTMK